MWNHHWLVVFVALNTLAAFIGAACVPAVAQAPVIAAPSVQISSGELRGVIENNLSVFLGIPYAAPPVGDLRWRVPQPVVPWEGVREASAFGNACMQPPGMPVANGGDPGPLSEDCLYLNVWTPKLDPVARLPVLVWIHGGAYLFGAGTLTIYNGQSLSSRGAVFVGASLATPYRKHLIRWR